MEFRRMRLDERDEIFGICKAIKNPSIKAFPNYWTRFKNWEKNAPFVLVDGGKIVGATGVTFQSSLDYVNLYAIFTTEESRGKGYGKILFSELLEECDRRGIKRIKTAADERFDGYTFFTRLGWKPSAKEGKEYKFDLNIRGVINIDQFKERTKTDKTMPIDARRYMTYDECYIPKGEWW